MSLREVALVAVLFGLVALPATADQCYLEGGTCALCWTTDSKGVRLGPQRCPESVTSDFVLGMPPAVYGDESVTVKYEIRVNTSALSLVPVKDDDGNVWDITHSNIHSCFGRVGIPCTPFVPDSPGLSTHTREQRSRLNEEGRAVFEAEVNLDEGFYTVIGHSQFYVLDDGVDQPVGGCGGKDCLKLYDVAFGRPKQVMRSTASPSRSCYLRTDGPQEDCALCWITNSKGVRRLEICPEGLISISQAIPPPPVIISSELYKLSTTLMLDKEALGLVKTDSPSGRVDISHANYHSCRDTAGACTPFVSDTPGLSTHTPEVFGDLDADGELQLDHSLTLSPGKYQVITHFRFMVTEDTDKPCGSAEGGLEPCPVSTYDIAVGSDVTVLPPETLASFIGCEKEPCMLCWVNDPIGRTEVLSPCPPGILPSFLKRPPHEMVANRAYDIGYALDLDSNRLQAVRRDRGEADLVQAGIVVCPEDCITCTPILGSAAPADEDHADLEHPPVFSNPGTITMMQGDWTAFRSSLILPPGQYTLIAYYQFYATVGADGAEAPPTCLDKGRPCLFEYQVALSMNREVLGSLGEDGQQDSGPQISGTGLLGGLVVVSILVALMVLAAVGYIVWLRRNGRRMPSLRPCRTVRTVSNNELGLSLSTLGEIVINIAPGGSLVVKNRLGSSVHNKLVRLSTMKDTQNLKFHRLAQPVVNLHEGLSDTMRNLPVRFLLASHVRSAKKLLCYEELTKSRNGFLDIPYSETTQKIWNHAAAVSWRWSQQKPAVMLPGFSPLSDMQLSELQSHLEANKKIEYVWLDWSCVPQYVSSPMFEVARSKLYYSRARTMIILPTIQELRSGNMRVVLTSIIRELTAWTTGSSAEPTGDKDGEEANPSETNTSPRPEPVSSNGSTDSEPHSMSEPAASGPDTSQSSILRTGSFVAAAFLQNALSGITANLEIEARRSSTTADGDDPAIGPAACGVSSRETSSRRRREDVLLACHALLRIRDRGIFSEFGYFGRVWTLAERMARHGRHESLRNWLNLEAWLGMCLDALWQASDPAETEHALPGLCYCWGRIFDAEKSKIVIRTLRLVRERGSTLASDWVTRDVAELFVDAVQIWRTAFVTEALDVVWLKNYLLRDAGHIYMSWHPEDLIFAIYTFFCWHVRDEFPDAHRDLCLLAGIDEQESLLWPVAEECLARLEEPLPAALGPYRSTSMGRSPSARDASRETAIGIPVQEGRRSALLRPIHETSKDDLDD